MKHVFTPIKKDEDIGGGFPIATNPVEDRIEALSRLAGPVALVLGYVGLYTLMRYYF